MIPIKYPYPQTNSYSPSLGGAKPPWYDESYIPPEPSYNRIPIPKSFSRCIHCHRDSHRVKGLSKTHIVCYPHNWYPYWICVDCDELQETYYKKVSEEKKKRAEEHKRKKKEEKERKEEEERIEIEELERQKKERRRLKFINEMQKIYCVRCDMGTKKPKRRKKGRSTVFSCPFCGNEFPKSSHPEQYTN